MADRTAISWCDHTENWWWGCSPVSRGCRLCYAETLAKRYGHDVWRRRGPRRMLSEKVWRRPYIWDKAAAAAGHMRLVFASSMADVFEDHPQLPPLRERAFGDVEATRNLLWLLLTKRPENIARMVPPPWLDRWPVNVWVGTSVEEQRYAAPRLDALLAVPAAGHFVSCEPLVAPLDVTPWLPGPGRRGRSLSWVIVGGESGVKAAPMHPAWARQLRDQATTAGVMFHFKQWGRWAPVAAWQPRVKVVHVDGSKPALWTPDTSMPASSVLMLPGSSKANGHVLDGREWVERPEMRCAA